MEDTIPTISTSDLKEFIRKKEGILIDVRRKEELSNGIIPSASHIPLDELETALIMENQGFQERYQFEKPNKEDQIVFYCRTGVRSERATELARKFGFNAKNYKGSIWEWSDIDPEVKKYGLGPM